MSPYSLLHFSMAPHAQWNVVSVKTAETGVTASAAARTAAISFFNAVMDSAKKSVGLYPKEKIGFDSIVSICPAERLDMLITDWDAAEEDLQAFEDKGMEIVVVDRTN